MKNNTVNFYGIISLLIIMADRLSKSWALQLPAEKTINEYLSFALTFNRGINWGFFNSQNATTFFLINILIALVILAFIGYTYFCWKLKKPIIGNILILSGALSNYFDRMMHGGVIDFIIVSFKTWSWPAFNVADAAICLGVGLILIPLFFDTNK